MVPTRLPGMSLEGRSADAASAHELSALQVENVSVSFGEMRALDGVSFSVDPGQISALIGPNGAGKTTMFNVIAGVIVPANGRVLLRGEVLTGRTVHDIATAGLRRTFQNSRLLLDMSVLDNVLVGLYSQFTYGWFRSMVRTPTVRRAEAALHAVGMDALAEFGLQDRAHHLAGSLPQGERRLLEIARNVASHPSMLLLDEPAAGLNESETARLGESLQHIRSRGVTVLLVEHDMSLVMEHAHHIVVLSHGKLLSQGTAREIQRDPRVVEAYLGSSREVSTAEEKEEADAHGA